MAGFVIFTIDAQSGCHIEGTTQYQLRNLHHATHSLDSGTHHFHTLLTLEVHGGFALRYVIESLLGHGIGKTELDERVLALALTHGYCPI
jgi:hypothetical protein